MSKPKKPAEPTLPRHRGRPQVHARPRRTTLLMDAEDYSEVRDFIRWRSFQEGRDLSLAAVFLEALRESDRWRGFKRAQK